MKNLINQIQLELCNKKSEIMHCISLLVKTGSLDTHSSNYKFLIDALSRIDSLDCLDNKTVVVNK